MDWRNMLHIVMEPCLIEWKSRYSSFTYATDRKNGLGIPVYEKELLPTPILQNK